MDLIGRKLPSFMEDRLMLAKMQIFTKAMVYLTMIHLMRMENAMRKLIFRVLGAVVILAALFVGFMIYIFAATSS
jgi:hypothetical protein